MYLFDLAPPHAPLLLAAMRSVALADGLETPKERVLLEVASDAFGGEASVGDPRLASLDSGERERLIQSMLLMALMDGSGSPHEAALVSSFAQSLGVEEPRVKNLEDLAAHLAVRARRRRPSRSAELPRAPSTRRAGDLRSLLRLGFSSRSRALTARDSSALQRASSVTYVRRIP